MVGFFFWFLIFVFFLELVFSTLKTKQTNQKTQGGLKKKCTVAHRGFFKKRNILSNSSPDATRKRKHVDSLKFLAGKQGQLAYLT